MLKTKFQQFYRVEGAFAEGAYAERERISPSKASQPTQQSSKGHLLGWLAKGASGR
jgi:hypothetical protein